MRLLGRPDRLPVVVAEHTAIVDALDAGDADAAVRRLEDHLDKIFQMIERLPDQVPPLRDRLIRRRATGESGAELARQPGVPQLWRATISKIH